MYGLVTPKLLQETTDETQIILRKWAWKGIPDGIGATVKRAIKTFFPTIQIASYIEF